jgi:CDP-6-deoxy-D-xylo-4-hexulose-3-dehydrase
MTVTDDFDLAEIMRIQRAHGWLRELKKPEVFHDKYPGIDQRFLFVDVGYNLRPTELQAAIGLVQLPKLKRFVEIRRKNTFFVQSRLESLAKVLRYQVEQPGGFSSCFGLPLILSGAESSRTREIREFLQAHGVETRPIICGNIARQPAMLHYSHRVSGELVNSDEVMAQGFTFGNHQELTEENLEYVCDLIQEFFQRA